MNNKEEKEKIQFHQKIEDPPQKNQSKFGGEQKYDYQSKRREMFTWGKDHDCYLYEFLLPQNHRRRLYHQERVTKIQMIYPSFGICYRTIFLFMLGLYD